MSTERETRFQEAASLLTVQLYRRFGYGIDLKDEDDKEWHILIAQFAYDLVSHAVESCCDQEQYYSARMTFEALLRDIPDLTAWPSEQA